MKITISSLFLGLMTHLLALSVNYLAWVENQLIAQVWLWVIMPFTIIGICVPSYKEVMHEKIRNGWFWAFTIISFPCMLWCCFGEGHNGQFYGLVNIIVHIAMVSVGIKKKQETEQI